jgi:hypothetical protein
VFHSEKVTLPTTTPSNNIDLTIEKAEEINTLKSIMEDNEVEADGTGNVSYKEAPIDKPRKFSPEEARAEERLNKVCSLR